MSVMLRADDPRGPKAVELAARAGGWLKCRTRDGRKAYGIRSSRDANVIHFATRTSCTCYDAQRHECKHMLAVRLHCELILEQARRARTWGAEAPSVEDVFARFEQDDRPVATPELSRILGKPRRGVIPASQIERED